MIESFIVYLGLMVIMMIPAGIGARMRQHRLMWAALSSLAFALVMAVRWNVGMDFMMYYKTYQQVQAGWLTFNFNRLEPLFRLLYWIFGSQNVHYSIPFGIIAFIQCFLIFVGLRKYPQTWVFIPMTLMLSVLFISYDNIMRHMLAFSIFICAIPYLAERQYWKYLGLILIAALFHKSALILLILPAIYSWCNQIFSKIWVELIIVAIGIVVMNIKAIQNLFETISVVLAMLGYEGYMKTKLAQADQEIKIGVGFFILQLVYLIPIVYSNITKRFYNSRAFNIMYDLFFIGYFVKLAFLRLFLMQRLNYYFLSFEFIIIAFTLEMFRKEKQWIPFAVLIGMYLITFYLKISANENNVVWYQTFWNA